jgi:hypothetical protein
MRLNVAVNNKVFMRDFQRAANLSGKFYRFVPFKRALLFDVLFKSFAM